MPIQIQTQAAGLLSALGVFGPEAPRQLEDTIQAGFDATQFWLARRLEHLGGTIAGTFAAPGVAVTEPVPAGEAWYLIGGTLAIGALAAGESCVASYAIRNQDGNVTRIFTQIGRTTVDAAGLNSFGFMISSPFILLPGCALIGQIEDENVAAARGISISALGYRFQV